MIEWVPGDFGGKVTAVNTGDMTITTDDGEVHKADAANVIPAQKAGMIAEAAGATDDTGWCPIDPHTMASTVVEDVYVVGDACIPGDMPKSGFSANSQAKVCAMAVRAALTGSDQFPARFRNTCWSTVAEGDTMKVGASYEATDEKIAKTDGFISEVGESTDLRQQDPRGGGCLVRQHHRRHLRLMLKRELGACRPRFGPAASGSLYQRYLA